MNKICSTCKKELDISHFYKKNDAKDGFCYKCKICMGHSGNPKKEPLDAEKIKLDINNNLTAQEIAEKYKYHPHVVRKFIKKNQIQYKWNRKNLRNNIINQKFGKLTVISYNSSNKDGRCIWNCICECGRNKEILGKYLLNGDTKSCGNCKDHKYIPNFYYGEIKTQALRRNKEFNVSKDYLESLYEKQNFKCALSNREIYFADTCKEKGKITASLDRIDSSIGYIEGNLQWVHKIVNYMKMDLKQETFIEFCKDISNNV